jgi:glyoxylase-like metal-dependent hydrolase (beta-lactamase superfamily II)
MNTYSIRTLFDKNSSTFTHIILDKSTLSAAIIDPVIEHHDRDIKLLSETGAKLKYIFETHVHADHITGADVLRQQTGAKVVYSYNSNVTEADITLSDHQTLNIGKTVITALETPGHTDSCMSYKLDNAVFTGDTLLIRGCGRTDFQSGSSKKLYESVHNKLFTLPDDTTVYPAHDYNGQISTTIGEEKHFNPRLNLSISKKQFQSIMDNLNLPEPKLIKTAIPANQLAGKGMKP